MPFRFGLLLACVWVLGCSAGGPPPVTPALVSAAQQRQPSASQASLESGRELFVSRCVSCHALPEPAAHDAGSWPSIVQRMGKLAKLEDAQAAQVLDYVLAARAQ